MIRTSTDKPRTAGDADLILIQNLNIKSDELISILIKEDYAETTPSAEYELDKTAESSSIKNHEVGLQQSKTQTYGNRYMGETTSDDEEEDIQKISSDSRNNIENTSSDDKGENNMIEPSLSKEESKLTPVGSPN